MNKSNYETEEKNMFVKEFLASGKTRVDFCKEKGISKSSLYHWTREYQAVGPEGIVFLPLMKRQGSIMPPHAASNDSPEIHLEVGIFHCYIKEQISSSFLRQVLEEVECLAF